MMRIALISCAALLATLSLRADGDPAMVSYEKDVLPILRTHCYACHDENKQTAAYRLDIRSQAMKGGESEQIAIKPGDAKGSELVKRITKNADDDERMPPRNAKAGPLSAKQIETIKTWIAAGAKWPDSLANEATRPHWAFVPPVKTKLPDVAKHPIDAFIRDRLAKEGLKPSPSADRRTLIRRLSLDLVGLPPTPAEVEAFVNDASPDAEQKLIDRLLASKHYGERWGRLWLDAARYADSDGYEKDKPRFVWFYRDWVIKAFNGNRPYDRFITEQLAGDLLPNATQDQRVATGFLRNSMINEEGGIDPEQFRMEAMFDRMDAVGKSMLGLTIQCAQCHTHKYDPISHQEYYRLFAFLNNSHEANITVYTPEEEKKRAELWAEIRKIEEQLKMKDAWQQYQNRPTKANPPGETSWVVIKAKVPDESTGGSKYNLQSDGSYLVNGYAPTKHGVKLEWHTHLERITAFRLELLTDPNLPRGGPGRSIEGTAALTEFEVLVGPADKSMPATKVRFVKALADEDMPEAPLKAIYADKSNRKRILGPVSLAIDGKDETAWGHDIDPVRRNQNFTALFLPDKPIEGFRGGTFLQIVLKQNHGGWNSDDNQNCNLGRFRLGVTVDPQPQLPARVDTFDRFRATVPAWKDANRQIDDLLARMPEGTTQLVYAERDRVRPTNLLKRGDFLKPGEFVSAGVPAALNPMPKDSTPNRLALAKWMTDRQSPTTARAFVNRIWQAYFGTGIVSTTEDLGTQCEPPSHPELLDWLAVEFMESGWDIKKLHRLIVTSETYRQSSKVLPEHLAKDPNNRLLARFPRIRVDAEIARDIALKASGLLTETVGGPSVYPPIPEFLMLPPASYGPKVWPESKGADRYRRAMYTFKFRSVPHPALSAFDAPTGDTSCVKRTRSNTPLQALAGLNEPLMLEAAQALGQTMAKAPGDDNTKIAVGFQRCTSRTPSAEEARVLRELLTAERGREPKGDTAWTAIGRVLLNLDETVTRE